MSQKTVFPGLIVASIVVLFAVILLEQHRLFGGTTSAPEKKADVIVIGGSDVAPGKQMPGVMFYHDLHTEYLQKNQNACDVCHLREKEEGPFVFRYKRIADGAPETDMAIYHDNCMGCHADEARKGETSGPLEGQCRLCHSSKKQVLQARHIPAFDKALHYRHETAGAIQGPAGRDAPNCGVCHHEYDEAADRIRYTAGEEQSCRYCHAETAVRPYTAADRFGQIRSALLYKDGKADSIRKKAAPMKEAAHAACVNCHLDQTKKQTGPVTCKGCHALEALKTIAAITDAPRMKRNQPDRVLMPGWSSPMTPEAATADAIGHSMNAVAFNHEQHESVAENCRSCHHDTLDACGQCHTVDGAGRGRFVTRETAMHASRSGQSCIGCHNRQKTAPECAGCHAQMPETARPAGDGACNTCHSVDLRNMEMEQLTPAVMSTMAENAIQTRKNGYGTVPAVNIPEMTSIGYLSDQYEATEFPHRKIFNAIAARLEKSPAGRLAEVFHGDDRTLCMGCHHNSPATITPGKCIACHGIADTATPDGRPSLKGAFHGQCITCHQEMNIETVRATDCLICHQEKQVRRGAGP